jgi:hypothetical protein
VFLGDYIDRGPASKEVLDLLVERRSRTEAVFLKGNHEDLFLKFLQNAAVLDTWRHAFPHRSDPLRSIGSMSCRRALRARERSTTGDDI